MMVSTAKLLLPFVLTSALVLAQAPPASAPAAAGNEEIKIAPGTVVPAELVKSLDSKKLKEGDPVTAKVSVDMLSGGTIVVPRDSKIVGHVTEAKSRGKGESESTLGIIFDRLILKNGTEFPIHATLQAVGPPITYRMAAELTRTPIPLRVPLRAAVTVHGAECPHRPQTQAHRGVRRTNRPIFRVESHSPPTPPVWLESLE